MQPFRFPTGKPSGRVFPQSPVRYPRSVFEAPTRVKPIGPRQMPWSLRDPVDATNDNIPANASMATNTAIANQISGKGVLATVSLYLNYGLAAHLHIDGETKSHVFDTTVLGRGISGDISYHDTFRSGILVHVENMTAAPVSGYVLLSGYLEDQDPLSY